MWPNNAINSDSQKRRFALPLAAGYGERWAAIEPVRSRKHITFVLFQQPADQTRRGFPLS
jgi:hypothetical protein